MCRPQLLTSQVRVCGGALASGGVKPPDGAGVAHSLRAAGRVCGGGARHPHARSREAGGVLPALRHVLAQSVVPSLWLCPWRTFGSVWGESGCLSVGAGRGGGGLFRLTPFNRPLTQPLVLRYQRSLSEGGSAPARPPQAWTPGPLFSRERGQML